MQSDWLTPPGIPALAPNSVQIWRFSLDSPSLDPLLKAAPRVLSGEELARAEKIRIPTVRSEFLAARTLLRILLASASGKPAASLEFDYSTAGKPRLAAHSDLAFNVSHSGGLILIALTRNGLVGIDLENLTQSRINLDEIEEIARATFPPPIAAQLITLPPGPERIRAFHLAWTIREAVAKADGRGIASPLKYSVFNSDQPNEFRVVLEPAGPAASSVEYRVHTLQIGEHHSAAVALSQPRQSLQLLDASSLTG